MAEHERFEGFSEKQPGSIMVTLISPGATVVEREA
jgi:hypothetical protein